MDAADPRLKTWGIALGVLFAALALVDLVVLKGEHVASVSVDLSTEAAPGVIEVSRPGEPHLVVIGTRRRVRGEYRGQSVSWRLLAPDGQVIEKDSELIAHKKRSFEFIPFEPGAYELHVAETSLLGGSRGSARVTVYLNDRRIIGPVLGF